MKLELFLREHEGSFYVLWDDEFDQDGFPVDNTPTDEEMGDFVYEKTGEYLEQCERDRAVANHYGFDNCVIFRK